MPRSPIQEGQLSETAGISPIRATKMKHITPDEVLQGFFYDDSVVRNLNKHGIDVANGHLQLLLASDVRILSSISYYSHLFVLYAPSS